MRWHNLKSNSTVKNWRVRGYGLKEASPVSAKTYSEIPGKQL
jgi:hypothetical protein